MEAYPAARTRNAADHIRIEPPDGFGGGSFSLRTGSWPWKVRPNSGFADFLDHLARALGVDTQMLMALASGDVEADAIIGIAPTGGQMLISTLDKWQEELRDLADTSSDGYYARTKRVAEAAKEKKKREEGRSTPARPCILYRLFDEYGRTLYVGVTRNPEARLRAHRKKWGALIASVATEAFDDAEAMLAAEREAIRAENPPLNIYGVEGANR